MDKCTSSIEYNIFFFDTQVGSTMTIILLMLVTYTSLNENESE